MVKTYFDFTIHSQINELLILIEKVDESTSSDSKLKDKMINFVKFALSKGEKAGILIIKFFFEKIRKNKKAAFILLSILFFSAGLSLNTLITNLNLSGSEQNYVIGLSVPGVKGSPIEPYDLKDDKKSTTELSKVQNPKIQKIIDEQIEKGYVFVDPKRVGVGKYFNKEKTIFTSSEFPYKVNYKSTKGVLFKYENQVDLIGKYIYELDKVATDEKIGLKLLALSMTYMEGFIKKTADGSPSTSYLTKNPGNIGNTDTKKRYFCKTLKEGITRQLDYIKRVAANKHSQYPIGEIIFQPPYYSDDLKKVVPGFIFTYEGTLEEYLKVYCTGARDNNDYLNVVLTFFETYSPVKITPKTKIKDIIDIGDKEKLIELIKKNNSNVLKSMSGHMLNNGYSIEEISLYTSLSQEEVKKSDFRSKSKRTTKTKKSWNIFDW